MFFWKSHSLFNIQLDLLKFIFYWSIVDFSLPGSSDSKESACSERDLGSSPKLGWSPGEKNSNPLKYSYLENSMDRPWGCKESDMTEQLTHLDLKWVSCRQCVYESCFCICSVTLCVLIGTFSLFTFNYSLFSLLGL